MTQATTGWKPNIQTTQAYSKNAGVKICVYGAAGVGKTPLAKTVGKALILAAEDGVGTVSAADIPLIRVRDTATLNGMKQWLKVPANIAQYDWIFLDSLSNLTQVIFTEVMETTKSADPRKFYGELTNRIIPFLEVLFSLDKNIVVTMWQGEQTTPAGAFQRYVPATKGQAIAQYCMHFFDVTLHMAKHQIQEQQADGTVQTVTRSFLQAHEFNFTFARTRHVHADGVTPKLGNFEPADLSVIYNKLIAN